METLKCGKGEWVDANFDWDKDYTVTSTGEVITDPTRLKEIRYKYSKSIT